MLPFEGGEGLALRGHLDDHIVEDTPHPEEHLDKFVHVAGADFLGHGVAHIGAVLQLDQLAFSAALGEDILGRVAAGPLALSGDKVHQVVDMDHVAAGKDAGDGGLHVLIDHRPVGAGVDFDAHPAG